MPIIIKNYEWQQTENSLIIKVPSNGAHPLKIDVFSSKRYLKVTYNYYFFEALLLHNIDNIRSNCTITDNYIVFELIKCEPILWEKLELDVDKAEKMRLKQASIDEEHKRLQDENKEKNDRKSELKRVAIREQIALDTKQRQHIEHIKKVEKTKALQGVERWHNTPRQSVKQAKTNKIPAVRGNNLTTFVDFTPRVFPTPLRESRIDEENEWLKKQAEARRTVGFISEDIRPEERNPQFLKSKGDEFMRNKNYLGAISAYSFGIGLNRNYVDLYVARSGAHLLQGNYMKTTEDCNRALELMQPECDANLNERALCIGRRGIALIHLGYIKQGIGELEISLKLVPNREFQDELNKAYEIDSD